MKNSLQNVDARRQKILDLLKENNTMYVHDLSRKLQVTEVTIRRDLDQLGAENKIERFHGGVKLAPNPAVSTPIPESALTLSPGLIKRQQENAWQKDLICRRVAELLEPGELVFMNSGTTVLYLLNHIAGKNLSIFTNNAAMAMVDRPIDTELTITGGEHFLRPQSMVGAIAKNTLSQVIATKCILGVSGISVASGITTTLYQETEINNLMLKRCQGKRIVAADPSKINRSHRFITCDIHAIDILVTLSDADEEEIEKIQNSGVEVIFADR